MKKTISLLLALVMVLGFLPNSIHAEEASVKGMKSKQEVMLNGEVVEIRAYLVENSNYFRLRDLAAILNGSSKQFKVDFDKKNKIVLIKTQTAYEKQETDLQEIPEGQVEAILKEATFVINDKEELIKVAFINNNNYINLRDFSKFAGYKVDFNKETKTVLIDTEDVKGEKEENSAKKEDKKEDKIEEQKDIKNLNIKYDFSDEDYVDNKTVYKKDGKASFYKTGVDENGKLVYAYSNLAGVAETADVITLQELNEMNDKYEAKMNPNNEIYNYEIVYEDVSFDINYSPAVIIAKEEDKDTDIHPLLFASKYSMLTVNDKEEKAFCVPLMKQDGVEFLGVVDDERIIALDYIKPYLGVLTEGEAKIFSKNFGSITISEILKRYPKANQFIVGYMIYDGEKNQIVSKYIIDISAFQK